MHLGADDLGVAQRDEGVRLGDEARPVPQEVESGDRRHHQQREGVDDGEAAADHPRQRADREGDHGAGMGADDLAQLVVDEIRTEMLLQMGQRAVGPGLHLDHVVRHLLQQQPKLGEDDGVEQQGEGQYSGEQTHDQQHGGKPARGADLSHSHRDRIKKIGDAGRGHEGQQDRGEEVEEQAKRRGQPDDQRDTLAPGGVGLHKSRRGRRQRGCRRRERHRLESRRRLGLDRRGRPCRRAREFHRPPVISSAPGLGCRARAIGCASRMAVIVSAPRHTLPRPCIERPVHREVDGDADQLSR